MNIFSNFTVTLIVCLGLLPFANSSDSKLKESISLKTPISIAFVGDSLTEGYGVQKKDAYPSVVERKLNAKQKNVKVMNSGIAGATSASGVKQVKWVLRAKPQWVVIALGANDGLRGLQVEEMKKNIKSCIQLAQSGGAKVILVGMKTPPNFGKEYGKKFESAYSEIAKEFKGVVYIPFLLDNVGGVRNLNIEDGIHPNEKGHEIMADMLIKVLEPLL